MSKANYSQDILFQAQLEKYFFEQWYHVSQSTDVFQLTKWKNNSCDNQGNYIPTVTESHGIDYVFWGNVLHNGKPIAHLSEEKIKVRWIPVAGQITFKLDDIRSYIREGYNILYIYNTVNDETNLENPKNYNLDNHIKAIRLKSNDIKWGVLWAQNVIRLYRYILENDFDDKFVLKQQDFGKWWNEYDWSA